MSWNTEPIQGEPSGVNFNRGDTFEDDIDQMMMEN